MKITNPSVTLKDGLWYGYTANSEAALVKISNQEEVGKFVWASGQPKHQQVYNLDGYEMAMGCNSDCPDYPMNCCHPSGCDQVKKVATISPIQKQEPERIKINDIFYVEGHERSHLCVGYQGVEMDPIAENGLPYQRSKCSLKPFPNFEKYSAYQQAETVATSGTNYVAPDNQEELWNDVISLLDIATFQNRAIEMLKDKFTITRKP